MIGMAGRFERSSCPLVSRWANARELDRGRKEEEGERGKGMGREEGSQGEFPRGEISGPHKVKTSALVSAEGEGLEIYRGHIKKRVPPDAGEGRGN